MMVLHNTLIYGKKVVMVISSNLEGQSAKEEYDRSFSALYRRSGWFCSHRTQYTVLTLEQKSGSGLPPTQTLHKDGWSEAHTALTTLCRDLHRFIYVLVTHTCSFL